MMTFAVTQCLHAQNGIEFYWFLSVNRTQLKSNILEWTKQIEQDERDGHIEWALYLRLERVKQNKTKQNRGIFSYEEIESK